MKKGVKSRLISAGKQIFFVSSIISIISDMLGQMHALIALIVTYPIISVMVFAMVVFFKWMVYDACLQLERKKAAQKRRKSKKNHKKSKK